MDEIVQFLSRTLPWSAVSDERQRSLVSSLLVEFFPRGTRVIEAGGPVPEFLHIIRVGAIDLLRPGAVQFPLVDRLGEGEAFDLAATTRELPPAHHAVAREDCLLYLVPRAELQRLLEVPRLRRFCLGSTEERLREHLGGCADAREPYGGVVADAITRPLVCCSSDTSIASAAQVMRDQGVSSVVVRGDPAGIVTDRDLRSRVVAAGLSSDQPVTAVMSQPLLAIPAEATVLEALLLLFERGIHHLAVHRGEQFVGLLTTSDLLRRYAGGLVQLPRLAELPSLPAQLSAYGRELDLAAAALWRRGVDASAINRSTTMAHDALIRRLLVEAQRSLGTPPTAFAWLALGSHGRMELALQRELACALVYDDSSPADASAAEPSGYFAALAQSVGQTLTGCGFAVAPAIAPAAPQGCFCQALTSWLGSVQGWASGSDLAARVLTDLAIDARRIAGELDIVGAIRSAVCQHGTEVAAAASPGRGPAAPATLDLPIGVLRDRFLEADGSLSEQLHLEQRAAKPLADLARSWALTAGCVGSTTAERLRHAGATGVVSPQLAADLVAADEWLAMLRLRRRIAGTPAPDLLEPAQLDGAARFALKDVIATIRAGLCLDRDGRLDVARDAL